eukprot:3939349-Rhodomonas_salina.2
MRQLWSAPQSCFSCKVLQPPHLRRRRRLLSYRTSFSHARATAPDALAYHILCAEVTPAVLLLGAQWPIMLFRYAWYCTGSMPTLDRSMYARPPRAAEPPDVPARGYRGSSKSSAAGAAARAGHRLHWDPNVSRASRAVGHVQEVSAREPFMEKLAAKGIGEPPAHCARLPRMRAFARLCPHGPLVVAREVFAPPQAQCRTAGDELQRHCARATPHCNLLKVITVKRVANDSIALPRQCNDVVAVRVRKYNTQECVLGVWVQKLCHVPLTGARLHPPGFAQVHALLYPTRGTVCTDEEVVNGCVAIWVRAPEHANTVAALPACAVCVRPRRQFRQAQQAHCIFTVAFPGVALEETGLNGGAKRQGRECAPRTAACGYGTLECVKIGLAADFADGCVPADTEVIHGSGDNDSDQRVAFPGRAVCAVLAHQNPEVVKE